jgi:hypothetical protein
MENVGVTNSIEETVPKEEEKLLSKDDVKQSMKHNKKHGLISKEKVTDSQEVLRLAVGGVVQAFDAIKRASTDLDPSEHKEFLINLLKNLKLANVPLEMIKHMCIMFAANADDISTEIGPKVQD